MPRAQAVDYFPGKNNTSPKTLRSAACWLPKLHEDWVILGDALPESRNAFEKPESSQD